MFQQTLVLSFLQENDAGKDKTKELHLPNGAENYTQSYMERNLSSLVP